MMKNQGCCPVNSIETALDGHFFLPFIVSDRSERIQQAARNKLIRFVIERAEEMKQIEEVVETSKTAPLMTTRPFRCRCTF